MHFSHKIIYCSIYQKKDDLHNIDNVLKKNVKTHVFSSELY